VQWRLSPFICCVPCCIRFDAPMRLCWVVSVSALLLNTYIPRSLARALAEPLSLNHFTFLNGPNSFFIMTHLESLRVLVHLQEFWTSAIALTSAWLIRLYINHSQKLDLPIIHMKDGDTTAAFIEGINKVDCSQWKPRSFILTLCISIPTSHSS
jgi:hypothetical protein